MSTIEYVVITRTNLQALEAGVQTHLSAGWKLAGGVTFGSGLWAQAATLEVKSNKKKPTLTKKGEPK